MCTDATKKEDRAISFKEILVKRSTETSFSGNIFGQTGFKSTRVIKKLTNTKIPSFRSKNSTFLRPLLVNLSK